MLLLFLFLNLYPIQHIEIYMNQPEFFRQSQLAFKGSFHKGTAKKRIASSVHQQTAKDPLFARYQRSIERKVNRIRRVQKERVQKDGAILSPYVHEYEYKQFSGQPPIQFSGPWLLFLSPILLQINLSLAKIEGITTPQFLFVASFVTFMFNHVYVLRKNRLMPYLPDRSDDNKLKIAAMLIMVAIVLSIFYGWSATGGILVAIIWQSLAGNQGCFYLIIFGGVIFGSITMELSTPTDFFMKIISSVLFGVAENLIHGLRKNNVYVIVNQISLTIMVGSILLYGVMEIKYTSFWLYLVMILLGFSVYFNLLLLVKLMQQERVSMVMGVSSGIILISVTEFVTASDYYASLAIVLSILVLLKIEYIDKEQQE